MLKILNAEPDDYSAEATSILKTFGTVDHGPLSREKLKQDIKNYDALIVRLGHKIDAEILAQAPHLKVIVTATTGLNHIDLNEVAKHKIQVLSLKGEDIFLNTIRATAEHTIGLMLALLRNSAGAIESTKSGNWDRNLFKGRELYGRTLGIIGYGRLGKIVARYAHAFEMRVLAYDIKQLDKSEYAELVDFPTLLKNSDIISLHASYSPENIDFINKTVFELMKPGSYFINTARGELVDESALIETLKKNHLAGAALDVLKDEHNTKRNWLKKNPCWQYSQKKKNLIITPHIGGATYDSMEKTEIFMAQKLRDWTLRNIES